MESKGGCCIARYGGGGFDISKVDRIMLRFRPIAPKPVAGGSSSGTSSPEMSASPKSSRGRKRSSKSSNSCTKRKRKCLNEESVNKAVTTLTLLPEIPDRGESPVVSNSEGKNKPDLPRWLSFGGFNEKQSDDDPVLTMHGSTYTTSVDRTVKKRTVTSCVTVECLTDTWMDDDGLGCTDTERKYRLDRDTCPGFISDVFGSVTWVNDAYKRMVGVGEDDNCVVWLVMQEKLAPFTVPVAVARHRAFTCRVRVQYDINGGGGSNNGLKSLITVPCDVWRMDGGDFAWRLDVQAALCLGR